MASSGRVRARVTSVFSVAIAIALMAACGGGAQPAAAPCDQQCQDGIATRALRETMKLAYNLLLQGKPVGAQDARGPCPFAGGDVHVTGTATSNAEQGATNVDLTYVFTHCGYQQTDSDPLQTYNMVLTGTFTQRGTLAVQPSATTAIEIAGTGVTLVGTVHDPPIDYSAMICDAAFGQNGNQLSGTLCGRTVGLTL